MKKFVDVFGPMHASPYRFGFLYFCDSVDDVFTCDAIRQLLNYFHVNWQPIHFGDDLKKMNVDKILLFTSDNESSSCTKTNDVREWILNQDLPLINLSQTHCKSDIFECKKHYLSNINGSSLSNNSVLTHDLALGYTFEGQVEDALYPIGLFLRNDLKKSLNHPDNINDPIKYCQTTYDYINLASKFEAIYTNRLHFAICSLLIGRKTTLLPGSCHKNKGAWEASLKSLGCKWNDNIPPLPFNKYIREKTIEEDFTSEPSLHFLLPTINKPGLRRMLDSICKETKICDYLTVVSDRNHQGVENVLSEVPFKCKVRHVKEKGLGYWGHLIRSKYQNNLEGDYILHCDDDNVYFPNAINNIRNFIMNQKNRNEVLLFRMLLGKDTKQIIWKRKNEVNFRNGFDTGGGVIPNKPPFPDWPAVHVGDGRFYLELLKRRPYKFVDEVIYWWGPHIK